MEAAEEDTAGWRQVDCGRVASSEISGGKFPEIYANLSVNLLKNVFTLYFLIITICI